MNWKRNGLICAVSNVALLATTWCGSQSLRFNVSRTDATKADIGTEALPILLPFRVPKGFTARVFARNIERPGMIAAASDGAVYVCRPEAGEIILLPAKVGAPVSAVSGINRPMGICLRGNRLYVCSAREILAANRRADGTLAPFDPLVHDLLPSITDGPDHALAFGPDNRLYFSLSGTSEAGGTIQRVAPDGSGRETFVTGLRGTTGFGWNPDSGAMWGMDSAFAVGQNLPEELNLLQAGKDYGWPARIAERHADLMLTDQSNSGDAARSEAPQMLYSAHSGATALAFYNQCAFPADYWNDAFITMQGDPDKGVVGKVVRIRFRVGKPMGFEDFLTGLRGPKGTPVFRPTGIVVAPDGALLVADAATNCIYRLSYDTSH